MTTDEVWGLVTANEALLRREVRRSLPAARAHEFDDLYSDVVYSRAHAIMKTYNPDNIPYAAPITHLCANVRWYAFKWVNYPKYKESLFDSTARDSRDEWSVDNGYTGVESSLTVDSILQRIPEDMADLLRWSLVRGNTPVEISAHLGIPVRDVKRLLQEAIELARDYAGVPDA